MISEHAVFRRFVKNFTESIQFDKLFHSDHEQYKKRRNDNTSIYESWNGKKYIKKTL